MRGKGKGGGVWILNNKLLNRIECINNIKALINKEIIDIKGKGY